jgi:hypothetical protein
MAGGLFLGGQIVRYYNLGHFNTTLDATAQQLPGLGTVDLSRVLRVVLRPVDQPMEFREDGVAVAVGEGMPAFSGEIIVTDVYDPRLITVILGSGATGSGRLSVIYYGH